MSVLDPTTELLDRLTPEARSLVEQLRALIRETIPGLTEKAYLGWSAIHYLAGDKMSDMVVGLGPQKAYVNLMFHAGSELTDTAHRLEGSGKQMRHVKIRGSQDVQSLEVRALLEQAGRLRGT